MLHLCPKCPAYVCLLESALFLPSLLLALHLRHITETYSVLPLKIGDIFMPSLSRHMYLLSPLKSECKESCKCRCILPVCWGHRADSREPGMLQHEAFGLWCFSGKPLILPAVQCSSCACYSWAGSPTVLGLRHFGHNCLCSLAVEMALGASPLWIAFTEPWLFSSLHNNHAFGREKPSAGCGVSCRWLFV